MRLAGGPDPFPAANAEATKSIVLPLLLNATTEEPTMTPCQRMGAHGISHDHARARVVDVTETIYESLAGNGGLFRRAAVPGVGVENSWNLVGLCHWQAATLKGCRRA
jgi:hypothetical protein